MVEFDVDFCRLCPRRSSCHYRGCIFDGKKEDLSRDEQFHVILCECIANNHEVLEALNTGSKKVR